MGESKLKNIYYFRHINFIGGIETFLYELAKKYQNKDLTIYYQTGDSEQIKRLKKYVRVKRYNGEKIECDRAFFNFNLDIIDNVEAKDYILVVHGNYKMLDGKPPQNDKITKIVAVSEDSAKAYTELTGLPCEVCYNPISIEKPKKVIHLISASRLADKVKGQDRMSKFVEALDRYCNKTGNKYMWTIFTDNKDAIQSKNISYMDTRLDIRDYIADADYTVQLSDNLEGYNYTINESLMLGIPAIITPCNVYEELGIDDTMSIKLDFDLSNIDEVIEQLFKKAGKFKFEYESPKDNWENLLVKGKSTYQQELKKKYLVEALPVYQQQKITDIELDRVPNDKEQWIVGKERLEFLLGNNDRELELVKLIKEIKE